MFKPLSEGEDYYITFVAQPFRMAEGTEKGKSDGIRGCKEER